jgi:hypothetical protein
MIVQTAPAGTAHFVILQTDHARTAGQFAAAFGNEQFSPLTPEEPMLFMTAHHDEGWAEVDAGARIDPATGLPYHLSQTPLDLLMITASGSPDFNEAFHPYAGLISSMHTYGLYHGRYGLSDWISIDHISGPLRPKVEAMLEAEVERQKRLKVRLRADSEFCALVDEEVIFHNYKLLQFFDTLSLYFQLTGEADRGESRFLNVPMRVGDDVTVTISRQEPGLYVLDPFPFACDPLEVFTLGRYLLPWDGEDEAVDMAGIMVQTTLDRQTYTLAAA